MQRFGAIAIGLIAVQCAPATAAPQTIDDIVKEGTIVVGVSPVTSGVKLFLVRILH